MKHNPLVSVSMITYNHELYIERAINGVLMQEIDFEIELIISNDNSPDNTDTIIRRIIQEHKNAHWIKYIIHTHNVGMMLNSFHNIQQCSGQYIAFCEGDDEWTDPLKLQNQLAEMNRYPNCQMSFHPARVFFGLSKTSELYAFHGLKKRLFTTREVIMAGCDFCPTAALMVKASAIKPLPDFYTNAPVGDYFVQVLASLHGGALYINRVMSVYRRNMSSLWR